LQPIYDMTFICMWMPNLPDRPFEQLAPAVLKIAPRVVVDQGRSQIWADGKSLEVEEICRDLEAVIQERGGTAVQIGVSTVPVAAEVAARTGGEVNSVIRVPAGQELQFLAAQPISALSPSPPVRNLFDGVGIETCGDLARLEQQSVEVRFGAEGVHLWRLARADDNRLIFAAMPRSLPQASLDWVDYTLSDPERLVFVINALVDNISTSLESQGHCAREMTLVFSLANRTSYEHPVRPSRSTSSRRAWMRLIRTHLDRIELPDSVTGIELRVEAVTGEVERQGDIFDRGFGTARATEETVAQLLDDQGAVIVVPSNSKHPLLERRTTWQVQDPSHAARAHMVKESRANPQLTLQLFPDPHRISVKTAKRRDHDLPVKYRDNEAWVLLESAAGPDRVSGEQWEKPFAREYYRCVTEEGTLVWIYREAMSGEWYMHGWWD
jgi:protein ImuB